MFGPVESGIDLGGLSGKKVRAEDLTHKEHTLGELLDHSAYNEFTESEM